MFLFANLAFMSFMCLARALMFFESFLHVDNFAASLMDVFNWPLHELPHFTLTLVIVSKLLKLTPTADGTQIIM